MFGDLNLSLVYTLNVCIVYMRKDYFTSRVAEVKFCNKHANLFVLGNT